MSTVLSVNLNKIALLRNSRAGNSPDVLEFARLAIEAGARGITVHPRPDQRHIRATDVYMLAEMLTGYPQIEFNIEGNPLEPEQGDYPGYMALVKAVQPDQATLVPDAVNQLTSDHGFDLAVSGEQLKPIIGSLKASGIRVSLFMDPDKDQILKAQQVGADRIELYTGPYAESFEKGQYEAVREQYRAASAYAQEIGLAVNAGHDLNLKNLPEFLVIEGISEVSIGHALTVEALRMGYEPTINAYRKICDASAAP